MNLQEARSHQREEAAVSPSRFLEVEVEERRRWLCLWVRVGLRIYIYYMVSLCPLI